MTLTPRELDVLRCAAQGMTDKEIARSLHLSAHTVAKIMQSAMHKLEAASRTQAVGTAYRTGLLA